MIPVFIAAAAVYVLFGDQIREKIAQAAPQVERKHLVGAALLAGAAWFWSQGAKPEPTPAPPAPDAAVILRGAFVGPDAATDAATVSALFAELAEELEWDGQQAEPYLKTGVAWDDLRTRARELRCRGVSLGEKHPRARQAIKEYLDRTAGTSGGPMSPAQRSAWVAAYREIARAADVAR